MFVSTWLIFLTTGLLITIGTLIWCIKTRQFDDQRRASYLPLVGLSPEELADKPPAKRGPTFYLFIFMLVMGPLSIVMVIFTMLSTS